MKPMLSRRTAQSIATCVTLLVLDCSRLYAQDTNAGKEVFDAICLPEKKKCRITISPQEFVINEDKTLPLRRVISWGKAGKGTRPDIGMALGSALITPIMPLAVFGLFKKKHEYIFEINHISDLGAPSTLYIKFLNKKPQDRFTEYLASVTGLGEHSISNQAANLYKFHKGSIFANFIGREKTSSAIYEYTARCEIRAAYSCIGGIQTGYPLVTPIVKF